MLKKIPICVFILFSALLLATSVHALDISAEHAIIIEAESQDIIYQKSAYTRAPMASTTKIMTAIVAIESGALDNEIRIPSECVGIEGSSIYLKEGEILTLRELLYALLLESANDAATAIAITVGGDISHFAELMNDKARKLGLNDTHFCNPHGLDDKDHYTTAYDLARLARYAMTLPEFKEIVSTFKREIPSGDDATRLLVNHNRLLRRYEGAIGVKTGYTKKSGRCLVSCAERNGVRLICVTLNAPSDWSDHKRLLDYGFERYERIELARAYDYSLSLSCVNGAKANVSCSNISDLSITLKKGDSSRLRAVFEGERFLFAPACKGDLVGKIVYYLDDISIASLDIYALESVKSIKYKKSIFERIFG
ncbi:MAG: D-alanyl-D-alanine carboxypeptidase [Clostridia bacterium]|nr:D-alanyl-D-alanine carboxypeptidase [Clostridia bacterium]